MKSHIKVPRFLKIFLSLLCIILIPIIAFILLNSGLGVNKSNLPKFIQADFVDSSRIYDISKFRSLAGHDFSGDGETCRSMKHYFTPLFDQAINNRSGLPPKPNGIDDIPIYSPVDGTITDISSERTPIGSQVSVKPDNASQFSIRIFHVWVSSGIHAGIPFTGWGGTHVKAGQKIGVIGAHQGTDIAIQVGTMPWNNSFVSYFDVMPDNIFATYKARGVTDRSDLIISKAYRDSHSVTCQSGGSQKFNLPNGYNSEDEDYFHLSGYISGSAIPSHNPPVQSTKP